MAGDDGERPTTSEAQALAEGTAEATTHGMELDPRARILQATTTLIAELGWTRVTTRKVAERAGVNNALVHYYFGTKRALLLQAATEGLMREFSGPLEALASGHDIGRGVLDAVAWLEGAATEGSSTRLVTEVMLQAVRDPDLQETSRIMLREFRHALEEKATRQGFPPRDAHGLATVLSALLDGLYLHVLLDPELDLRAAADALRPLFPEEAA